MALTTPPIEIHDIDRIEFGIYSPDELRSLSVAKIDNKEMSGPGSIYDPKMGCSGDTNDPCITCGLKKQCWGHFGHIELAEPVLHPMYYKAISLFLKCICKQCHRLLINREQIELYGLSKIKGQQKFSKITEKMKKIDMCSYCSSPQPKITFKSKDMTISMEYKQKKGDKESSKISIIMTVEDIKKIFDNIPLEDIEMMGFDPSRMSPKNLILTVLPVIPPCSRPYVITEGNICDDDLTYQLIEIVKINIQLQKEDIKDEKKQKLIQSLKFRISTMMNNSKSKAKHPTDSRPLKGLKERLGGKQGRLRNNLMGKRVDYSSRSVIGADPTLKLNQVAIPYEVARIHTKPELVTSFNIKWLTEIVNSGKANFITTIKVKKDEFGNEIPDPTGQKTRINLQYGMYKRGTELLYGDIIVKDPSLNFKINKKGTLIIPKNNDSLTEVLTGNEKVNEGDRLIRDGNLIDLKIASKKDIVLKVGDLVERHLIKGDITLFNRQPTLHRGSMLGMEVIPMPHKSFRFNLAITRLILVSNREC